MRQPGGKANSARNVFKRRKTMTFVERLRNLPPGMCRLLARSPYGPPFTTDEIAERTRKMGDGVKPLSSAEVEAISRSTEWNRIAIEDALAFMCGCNVDFCDAKAMHRVDDYLRKRPTFRYLRASSVWTTYYTPLLLKWRDTATPTWEPLCKLQQRLLTLKPHELQRANRPAPATSAT